MENTVKKLRTNLNYTQRDMANILGVNQSTICYYENGVRFPKPSIARKLIALANSNGQNINLNDLLFGLNNQ